FHIGQRRPDKVVDAGFFGRTYRGRCLLDLVGARFPKIGGQEDAVGSCKRGLEGLRAIEIRLDDFVGESAVLAWMAGQRTYLELALGLEGAHDRASLVSRGADHGDQLLAVG